MARNSAVLTDLQCAAEKPDPDRVREVHDADDRAKGLALVVNPSGKKSWTFRYRTTGKPARQRRINLGRYPAMTLKEARDIADRYRAEVKAGGDPVLAVKKAQEGILPAGATKTLTMSDLWSLYVDAAKSGRWLTKRTKKKKRAATLRSEESYWRFAVEPRFGRDDITLVDAERLAGLIDAVYRGRGDGLDPQRVKLRKARDGTSASAARIVDSTLRVVFDYAVSIKVLTRSPMRDVEPPRNATAEGVDDVDDFAFLDDDPDGLDPLPRADMSKIWRVWRVLDQPILGVSDSVRLALQLCAFTLQRRAEIAGLLKSEVRADVLTITAARAKHRRANAVPLSPQAAAIVKEAIGLSGDAGAVFPSKASGVPVQPAALTHAWTKVTKAAGVKEFTLHHWRHYGVTALTRAGVAPYVGSLTLSHALNDGSAQVTTDHYQKHKFVRERRAALDQWANILVDITSREHDPADAITKT